ncbi:hypothetical protein KC19_9G137800 [Ceratodon purpureus]|uniref:N-acetyltransferase domain-containing protein n=1 Tax=Ceratodon purpureus TaxID=3225 RepID=A0A8T0GRP3_CERPU|nr:hypothetical protein KC19_9G137800 [Ceratodon purpureus]
MENPVEDPTRGLAMKRLVTVKLATKKDAHFVHKLVGELAEYQRLASAFIATEKELEDTLFNFPPYQGPTTFILESTVPNPALDGSHATSGLPQQHLTADEGATMEQTRRSSAGGAEPSEVHAQEIILRHEITDMAMDAYKCQGRDPNRVVVGFVLFFPNFSTLVAKAGYYVEDLYIREPYRGHGFGTVLLKTVAQQALQRGAERLEWCVLDWDENALNFYKSLGAAVLPEWRICRLSGDALKQCEAQLLHFTLQSPHHTTK